MTMQEAKALELLATAAVYRPLDRVVHVRGDDAESWLNGQVTNDVRELGADEARYALTLTAKGRVVSDLWVTEEPPGMALVLPIAHSEATLERLDKHIIMEDVELVPDAELEVLTVQGPLAREVVEAVPAVRRYVCARLTPGGMDVWVERTQLEPAYAALVEGARAVGGGPIDVESWAEAHVALAVPRLGIDFGDDTYPQEAGLGPRALSFGKGCYLGQEVVYMLENRGQLPRRLVQLEIASPAVEVAAPVLDDEGKRVGEVTSAAPNGSGALALAFVKRTWAEPDKQLFVAGSSARVRRVVGVG